MDTNRTGSRREAQQKGDHAPFTPAFFSAAAPHRAPHVPGGSLDALRAELGIARFVKLASNEHQLGPTRAAREAIVAGAASAHLYPDSDARLLRDALAAHHGVAADQIVAGAGGDGCIDA